MNRVNCQLSELYRVTRTPREKYTSSVCNRARETHCALKFRSEVWNSLEYSSWSGKCLRTFELLEMICFPERGPRGSSQVLASPPRPKRLRANSTRAVALCARMWAREPCTASATWMPTSTVRCRPQGDPHRSRDSPHLKQCRMHLATRYELSVHRMAFNAERPRNNGAFHHAPRCTVR